jgi:hypothetical protein
VRFPDFDALTLDYPQLQAVLREHRYAGWRTALASVIGIYLITDTSDGRHYVGKADGQENLLQRWAAYAANGHGGNVELKASIQARFADRSSACSTRRRRLGTSMPLRLTSSTR